jgi:hypothetical protein
MEPSVGLGIGSDTRDILDKIRKECEPKIVIKANTRFLWQGKNRSRTEPDDSSQVKESSEGVKIGEGEEGGEIERGGKRERKGERNRKNSMYRLVTFDVG